MAFNINTFRSSIAANGGVMRNNKFRVVFQPPTGIISTAGIVNTAGSLQYWADAANLPGVSMNVTENYRFGYGHREKKPMNGVFNDMQISFISDANGSVWKFFHEWTKLIYNYDLKDPLGQNSNSTGALVAYKDDYATDVAVTVYDEGNNETMTVYLRDAFPTVLGEVQLNWRDRNNYARFSVTFSYTDWYLDRSNTNE